LRGEVAVTFSSNRPERSAPGSVLFAGERELVVRTSRPHQGRVLLTFTGIDDRTALIRSPNNEWSVAGAGKVTLFREHKLVGLDALT